MPYTKIKCPKCDLEIDFNLSKDPEPVFDVYYLSDERTCPNCETIIHLAVTGNGPCQGEL